MIQHILVYNDEVLAQQAVCPTILIQHLLLNNDEIVLLSQYNAAAMTNHHHQKDLQNLQINKKHGHQGKSKF